MVILVVSLSYCVKNIQIMSEGILIHKWFILLYYNPIKTSYMVKIFIRKSITFIIRNKELCRIIMLAVVKKG